MLHDWQPFLTFLALEQELTGKGVVRILLAAGALVLLLTVGFFVVSRLRRRLQEPDQPLAGAGFTLADLRQLHKNGQMSTEEFERAKAKVVENAKRAAEREAQRAGGDRKAAERFDGTGGLF